MKKLLLFCIVAVFCGNAMAQKITGATVIITPNGTADLELSIESEELAAIAQVTLQFPENLSIATKSNGKYKYTLGELCNEGHTATVKDKKDGSVLVLVQNNDGDPFEANAGVLITLPLTAGNIAPGEYTINMADIVLGTNDSPSRKLNTETSGTVNVVVKNKTTIVVSDASISGTFGQGLTAPSVTVTDGYDGVLSYKSSDENVIKVATDGKLTVVGAGAGTITIGGTETATYLAPEDVTYNVQIDKAAITPVVTLVGWTYGQAPNEPSVTGNDGEGTVTYQYKSTNDNAYSAQVPVNSGNYVVKAVVEATANYKGGEATANFTIAPKSVTSAMIQTIASQVYTGSALTPAITVKDGDNTLALTTDYTVAYTNNINAGTATVTITGQGNYKDTASKTFVIARKPVTANMIQTIDDQLYTGSALTPAITVKDGNKTLALTTDYTVAYSNNINAGTATITITGQGNYKDTASKTFVIEAKSLSDNMVTDIEKQFYTGSNIEPKPVVTDGNKVLVEGTDYTIAYSNNKEHGIATVTITGKGNYQGTVIKQFAIKKKGDVNDNGDVDALDIQDTITLMCNDEYLEDADLNEDNVVDALDIMDVITEILNQ